MTRRTPQSAELLMKFALTPWIFQALQLWPFISYNQGYISVGFSWNIHSINGVLLVLITGKGPWPYLDSHWFISPFNYMYGPL